jgi:hypothetical protein
MIWSGEIWNNLLIEFYVTMKLDTFINMYLNKTCNKFLIGNNLSNTFPTQDSLKRGDDLSLLLFKFALEHAIKTTEANKNHQSKVTIIWVKKQSLAV